MNQSEFDQFFQSENARIREVFEKPHTRQAEARSKDAIALKALQKLGKPEELPHLNRMEALLATLAFEIASLKAHNQELVQQAKDLRQELDIVKSFLEIQFPSDS